MKTMSKTIDSAGQVTNDGHHHDREIITIMTTIMGPGPLNT
jgi:hypothetical protein